jgi:DNA-binding response OmpR family regulator
MYLVEDEKALAKILKDEFTEEGFTVQIAKDGEQAIKNVKAFMPNVIVLDLLLPKKDGFEVLKFLKSDDMLHSVPVIVVSNLGQDEHIKRALQMGAVDYFVKTQHPMKEIVEKVKASALRP